MYKKPIIVIWTAAAVVALVVIGLVFWKREQIYSEDYSATPNRAKSYGTGKYVSDIRIGWCNNDGQIIEENFFTDSLSVTVFLQNFDGWLLDQVQSESRLAPADFKNDLSFYITMLKLKRDGKKLTPEQEASVQTIQPRLNHWIVQERSNLRLSIAGQVFETIPPFDTSAPPTYGSGEFAGETYNRIVFHLAAPKDAKELERWHSVIRAVGAECEAEITVARPLAGATDALRLPTLVNADVVYGTGAQVVRRRLPLVPPMRQGSAALTVIFTSAAIFAAGAGTRALRDGRDPTLPADKEAPWSLARVVFAWWLTICVASFAYLWALMGEHRNTLSKSVPLLLGIQGGTMLISAGFARVRGAVRTSEGFFTDLISEAGEAEVSRLQMLVWNLVLGVVFLWQSIFEWKMPEFDATLMTLIGISSTAYVGFKFLPAAGKAQRENGKDK